MALNFSEWNNSHTKPKYQIEGKEPKCPEGHKWDKTLQTCIPDTKNNENPGDKEMPQPLAPYNVWGSHGLNGEPPAVEVEESIMYHRTEKDIKRDLEKDKEHKAQDDRMRYGKSGKPPKETLSRGEVKTWDKIQKRWVSNKSGK